MTAIFWLVDQSTRVELMQLNWKLYKKKLEIPDEEKQAPHNPGLEPEPDRELTKLMETPPSAVGRGGY